MNEIYRDSVGGNAPTWDQLSPFLKQSNIAAADHMCVKLRILLPEDDIHYSSILSPDILSKGYRTYLQVKDTRADEFRRIEHERWSRFHVMNNWSYAEKRDNSKRKHPMLVPFDQLNEENQIKDSFAWDLLEFLSKS